jgi:hypothetical protein
MGMSRVRGPFLAHRPALVSSCTPRAGQYDVGGFSNARGLCDSLDEEQERTVGLLLLGKGAVLAHGFDRPLAVEMDELGQSPFPRERLDTGSRIRVRLSHKSSRRSEGAFR